MKAVPTLICLLGTVTLGSPAPANGKEIAFPPGAAGHCYRQTVLLAAGTAAEELSVASCNRALRGKDLRADEQSKILYNRGLILQAQGVLEGAQESFARAVSLSRTVDLRNVALAQLAHKRGDLSTALEQYELLEQSGARELSATTIATVRRNKDRVLKAIYEQQLANL